MKRCNSNSATKATKGKNSRGSLTKYAANFSHSEQVRALKEEIKELKHELREQTSWADQYFRMCERLNSKLNKYRAKDQSLLRTMVVQAGAQKPTRKNRRNNNG